MSVNTPTITLASIVTQNPNQVATRLGQEIVILGLISDHYYSLGDVGAQIWTLLETPIAVQSILETLLKQYDVEPALCQSDLLAVLRDLAAEGLIDVR